MYQLRHIQIYIKTSGKVNNKNYSFMESYSFYKGYGQVQRKDTVRVRTEIMEALGIKTKMGFYQRLAGKIEPRVSEVTAIEAVFTKYGIKNIWGGKES